MEDLAAAGRAADRTILQPQPGARPATSAAEALRPPEVAPGATPLPEMAGRPVIRLGEWNNWSGVA
jgi:hypothetical protein